MLTPQQRAFFTTFGYLALPGLLADSVGWISEEFEAAWAARPDLVHDGSRRTMHPDLFVSARPRLSTLIEDRRIVGICEDLLGPGYGLNGGDGNFYSGDTGWHSDVGGDHWHHKTVTRHLKIAFYLDPVTRDTGALRVIPGSHHYGDSYTTRLNDLGDLGLDGRDVPAVALETMPGDLVLFDHRLKHAAFGGGNRRRMFTLNLQQECLTRAQRESFMQVMRWYYDVEHVRALFRPEWLAAAPPERLRRLAPSIGMWDEMVRERGLVAAV